VPSALAQFANPVPASQALPASLYLVAMPSWWGSVSWPAVGPDARNGDIAGLGGFASRNPARRCYDTTPKVAGILTYNANNCYTQTPPPSPPSNLTVN
jgi:hypothetical protein